MIPSESMTVRSSKSTLAGRAGLVPVAITIFSALAVRTRPSTSATSTAFGLAKWAVPVRMATRLRESWLRTTSFSFAVTSTHSPSPLAPIRPRAIEKPRSV